MRYFDVFQIFFSPQVKGCVVITYKHGIYYLPHELSNDLRLRILGNSKILEKSLKLHRKMAQCLVFLPK